MMGSTDATCMASNIRIRYGEEIYAVILVSSGENENWEPVGLPILGKYNDYGAIELNNEEEGNQLIDWIRPWIVPQTGFDPATIGFYEFQDQCWHGLSVFPNLDNDNEVKSIEYWPYNQLNIALKASGFHYVCSPIGEGDSNVLTISTSSSSLNQIERLEAFLREHNYEVMRVSSFGTSKGVLFEGRRVFDLILAPKADDPRTNTYLGIPHKEPNRAVRIGFIRKDFYDRMVPGEKHFPRAEKITEELKSHFWFSRRNEDQHHVLFSLKRTLDLFGIDDRSEIGSKTISRYIRSLPDDFSPEQLLKLIRYDEFLLLMRCRLAVGIRPTPLYVGSQSATEDWPTQRQAHKVCDEILRDLISKRNEDLLLDEALE